MALRFPDESPEYRAARDPLLAREVELRRLTEEVARERRALPPGGEVKTPYAFEEARPDGTRTKVSLAELFAAHETLAVYSYMFGPERQTPCSMCTPLLDGLDAGLPHIEQRLALVVVSESPAPRLRAFADERGWALRLLSTAGNTYNRDYFGKTPEGKDMTMLNLFRRSGDRVRHFWGSELAHEPCDPGQDMRHLDVLNPIFGMLDLTPEGRGEFTTRLSYD